jgi:hypothetical protein
MGSEGDFPSFIRSANSVGGTVHVVVLDLTEMSKVRSMDQNPLVVIDAGSGGCERNGFTSQGQSTLHSTVWALKE